MAKIKIEKVNFQPFDVNITINIKSAKELCNWLNPIEISVHDDNYDDLDFASELLKEIQKSIKDATDD